MPTFAYLQYGAYTFGDGRFSSRYVSIRRYERKVARCAGPVQRATNAKEFYFGFDLNGQQYNIKDYVLIKCRLDESNVRYGRIKEIFVRLDGLNKIRIRVERCHRSRDQDGVYSIEHVDEMLECDAARVAGRIVVLNRDSANVTRARNMKAEDIALSTPQLRVKTE